MAIWQGHDLAPAHRRWRFWIAEGRDELPDVRTSSEIIPFRRGRLHQPAIGDKRSLEIRGYIQEITDPAMQAELDLLKGLLDPERFEPGLLEDDFEDGTHRWIRAVPGNLLPRYGGEHTRLLSIELESPDPYWYSAVGALTLDSGLLLDDGYLLDAGAEIIVDAAESETEFEIANPGTTVTERISVRMAGASSAGIGIENVTAGGVGFTSSRVLAVGDEVLVDAMARAMTLNGASLRAEATLRPGGVHGQYLTLLPGINRLRIHGRPTETRLLYFPAYL